MSQVDIRSPKHCAQKRTNIDSKLYKKLFIAFSSLFTTILSIILIVWLIIHPSKPEFSLTEAELYQLNLAAGPTAKLLNTSIQLTIVSKNPNQKLGIYYDELHVYAAYKGQQITVFTSLPPFYQGHDDTNVLSASLIGNGFPVGPSLGYEVGRDQTVGRLVLNLKVNGQLRWKVGAWISGKYRFFVNCVAVLFFDANLPGTGPGPSSLKQGTQCSTTV